MWGEHRLFDRKVAYEESIRVPLVIRAPGGRAGVVEPALVINNDLAPTLAQLGGASTTHVPDGTSLVSLIAAAPATGWQAREHFLVEHWYLRGLLKHDAPTYLAWRGKIGGGPDFTYIGTRALPDDFDITVSTREFYDLGTDPFQQFPVELPQDLGDYFDLLLRVFEGCAGDGCRAIEIP
jgi:arylsulfatase A-like enzyme